MGAAGVVTGAAATGIAGVFTGAEAMGTAGVVTGAATAAREEKWQQGKAGEEVQFAAVSAQKHTVC
jgi:hypothetical protein